jgi:hypothetical protein
MIDAAEISLRHMRIDMNSRTTKSLALFACLLLALTGALAASLQSIQRLPFRSSLHDCQRDECKVRSSDLKSATNRSGAGGI